MATKNKKIATVFIVRSIEGGILGVYSTYDIAKEVCNEDNDEYIDSRTVWGK